MDNDEIIEKSAKQLFCFILEQRHKQSLSLMMSVVAMGPTPCLRFLSCMGDMIDFFHGYLGECSKYDLNESAFNCAISRFSNAQKKGERFIKMGDWD